MRSFNPYEQDYSEFYEPSDPGFLNEIVAPPPVAAAPAPAPAGQWVRQPSGGEGWEDVFVPAPGAATPIAPPRPTLSLPTGWATDWTEVIPRSEDIGETRTGTYSFGPRDEDILRSLGFQGPVIQDVPVSEYQDGSYFNYTTPGLTPEAQKFLEQGGYQLAAKNAPGGSWFGAFDPTGKLVGTPAFRKDEDNDPLLNAVFAALSVAAGNVMGPGMALVNAAQAFGSGNTLGGLASLAGGVGGLGGTVGADVANAAKTVGQGLNVARAIEQRDPLGLLASGAALTNTNDIGGVPVKDILNYGKVAQAIANEDVVGALGALGNVNKDFRLPSEIADPLNIVSGLYQASQGSGRGLVNAIGSIANEAEIRAGGGDDEGPIKIVGPGTAPAPTATDASTEDFESAMPEAPDEEEPDVFAPAPYNPPEQEYTQDQAIEELLRGYSEPEQYQPEEPEPVAPERVEVTGSSLSSPVSVEDILSAGIEQPRFTTAEQLPVPAQQIVTTGAREEPATMVNDLIASGLQETGPSDLPSPLLDGGIEEEDQKAREGTQTVEVTGSRPGLSTAPELATPILDLDAILREGIDLGPGPKVEDILGPPPVVAAPAPAPSPAPAPAPSPAPATKPKSREDLSWLFTLMGMMGNQQTPKETRNAANIRAQSPFGTVFDRGADTESPSIEDLIKIMRG